MRIKIKKVRDIQADLVSRENALNGKYNACQCGLSGAEVCRQNDSVYLEGLSMKADLLDDLIIKNEKEGEDTNNLEVLKKLGEEINTIFHPICKTELLGCIIGSYLAFLLFYGVAIGIWCLVFKKSFLSFFMCGAVLGILVCSIFSLPVIMVRRSKERIKEVEIVLGYLWTNLAIVIGIVGFIALAIRAIFFK